MYIRYYNPKYASSFVSTGQLKDLLKLLKDLLKDLNKALRDLADSLKGLLKAPRRLLQGTHSSHFKGLPKHCNHVRTCLYSSTQ